MDPALTPHFAYHEFAQPAAYDLPAAPYPIAWVSERLIPLCHVLEALRTELQRPVIILHGGGYRSMEWNVRHHEQHPGAVLASQHCEGRAADVWVPGVPAPDVYNLARRLLDEGRVKFGGLGLYADFVHIDTRPGAVLERWRG